MVVVVFKLWFVDKGVYTFPKGISMKVNAVTWLAFEPAYYDVTLQHISHSSWEFPSLSKMTKFALYLDFSFQHRSCL